ncbi:MAG: LysR family transcriptional regulator [Pseudomonadaceae bacterium]|nr:LysR family transcriptional regulator [Pseudomonadaceae bacterium]
MNFHDLATFMTVAQEASFSNAAAVLHITQPAVSKRIQALEQRFGAQLFDRVGKQVHLTQAGAALVPQAQLMLATLADTEKQLHNLAQNVAGSLTLATSHHIGLHRLAPVLRRFVSLYPQVQMNISFEDSEVAHDRVRQGRSEVAVVTLNPEGEQQLQSQVIWQDPLVFVAAPDSPRKVSLAWLADQPCVLPGAGTFTGRIVLQRFSEQGLLLTPTMSTNYLETIGMLVNVGLGWSVLPRSMIGELSVLSVDCAPMSRALGHVINPARTLSNAASAFVDVLKEFSDDYAGLKLPI